MRTFLIFFGMSLSIPQWATAQVVKTFLVNTWEVPVKVIPQEEQTRYPDFRDGVVYYSNGKTEAFKMNYSMLYGEMQFIGPKGDTLALADESRVRRVVIDQATYYSLFGKGFVEVLTPAVPVALGRRLFLQVVLGEGLGQPEYRQDNSYGGPPPTLRQVYHRKTEGLMKVGKYVFYMFIDRNQRIYPARKSVLFELFPGCRRQINAYLKTHGVDFKRQEDLEQLVQFCSNIAGM